MVSVIIPTYNRAKTIMNSVNSVLNQSYKDIELIVVDDCSVDDTEGVIAAVNDCRVKYIRTEVNGGAGTARNVGIRAAASELIAFQDSDDCWKPNKLEEQVKLINNHSEYGLVYTQMVCKYVDDERSDSYIPNETVADSECSGYILKALLKRNYISTPTMLIRRSVLEDVGYFDESFKCLEDWELVLRIASKYQIGYVDKPLHIYKVANSDNVSSKVNNHFEAQCRIIAMYRNTLLENGLFNEVVGNMLAKAEEFGILKQVGKILELYLSNV